jgi:NodT family efflux transporter outer membrane factor (OMF) lipoprotein
VESLQAQVDYQKFQLEDTYLNLIAGVINAVVQEASLSEQIKETENIIGILQEQMKVLHDQLKLNIITKASVLSQEATLLETQATLPLLQKQRMQARSQLAALIGRFPSEMKNDNFLLEMLHLPEELPLSLPSKLVEQRPDIRSAEERLHAASAEIGVATARMLPQINLSASYGSAVRDFNDLFLPNSEVWNVGAGLVQPLFHGGQLLHAKRAAVARYDIAAAQYRNTVLLAFRNVADVLHSLKLDADALKIQVDSARAAAENLDVTRTQFKVGTISYLALLDAERTHLQAQLRLVEARARRLSDTVALFQALGGGWWNRAG